MERSVSPFEQYGKATPQTDVALRVHVFASTDTLSGLAQQYLGDWRLWREIAQRNGVSDPRRIPTGTVLLIPPRTLSRGEYEV